MTDFIKKPSLERLRATDLRLGMDMRFKDELELPPPDVLEREKRMFNKLIYNSEYKPASSIHTKFFDPSAHRTLTESARHALSARILDEVHKDVGFKAALNRIHRTGMAEPVTHQLVTSKKELNMIIHGTAPEKMYRQVLSDIDGTFGYVLAVGDQNIGHDWEEWQPEDAWSRESKMPDRYAQAYRLYQDHDAPQGQIAIYPSGRMVAMADTALELELLGNNLRKAVEDYSRYMTKMFKWHQSDPDAFITAHVHLMQLHFEHCDKDWLRSKDVKTLCLWNVTTPDLEAYPMSWMQLTGTGAIVFRGSAYATRKNLEILKRVLTYYAEQNENKRWNRGDGRESWRRKDDSIPDVWHPTHPFIENLSPNEGIFDVIDRLMSRLTS